MENATFAEEMKSRTKLLARDIILFTTKMPDDEIARIMIRQLVRSSSSTAANYRAVCRARSGNEFYAKLSITLEEADESLFWLELISETAIAKNSEELEDLKSRANSVIAILAKARKSCKIQLKK